MLKLFHAFIHILAALTIKGFCQVTFLLWKCSSSSSGCLPAPEQCSVLHPYFWQEWKSSREPATNRLQPGHITSCTVHVSRPLQSSGWVMVPRKNSQTLWPVWCSVPDGCKQFLQQHLLLILWDKCTKLADSKRSFAITKPRDFLACYLLFPFTYLK